MESKDGTPENGTRSNLGPFSLKGSSRCSVADKHDPTSKGDCTIEQRKRKQTLETNAIKARERRKRQKGEREKEKELIIRVSQETLEIKRANEDLRRKILSYETALCALPSRSNNQNVGGNTIDEMITAVPPTTIGERITTTLPTGVPTLFSATPNPRPFLQQPRYMSTIEMRVSGVAGPTLQFPLDTVALNQASLNRHARQEY